MCVTANQFFNKWCAGGYKDAASEDELVNYLGIQPNQAVRSDLALDVKMQTGQALDVYHCPAPLIPPPPSLFVICVAVLPVAVGH